MPRHYFRVFCRLLIVLSSSFFVAGCGSAGERVLGNNSRAEVYVESQSIANLDLIVAPLEGDVNSPDTCSLEGPGFNCEQMLRVNSITYRFDTRFEASTQPFRVYVRNVTNTPTFIFLQVLLDDEEKVNLSARLGPRETALLAKVLRNSACLVGVDCR